MFKILDEYILANPKYTKLLNVNANNTAKIIFESKFNFNSDGIYSNSENLF